MIALIMNSCSIFQKNIKRLDYSLVDFNSLPVEIKELFYNKKNIPLEEVRDFTEIDLFTFNTAYKYEYKTIDLAKDLWISHYLLIDKTNNITYRIDSGTPFPVFVNGTELFIPTKFMVFSVREEYLDTLSFKKYSLETNKLRRRSK
ncbi:hypothetical protein LJC37_04585 [Bacteroidales bacterium OttesenSCG-928-E04]|nr:hypothetical protein [Bacteroidales bacterium OttesenSCG-928-E04]